MKVLKRIKELREKNNLKTEDMAERMNMSERSYKNLELGKTKLRIIRLIQLADIFDTSADYIVEITDDIARY